MSCFQRISVHTRQIVVSMEPVPHPQKPCLLASLSALTGSLHMRASVRAPGESQREVGELISTALGIQGKGHPASYRPGPLACYLLLGLLSGGSLSPTLWTPQTSGFQSGQWGLLGDWNVWEAGDRLWGHWFFSDKCTVNQTSNCCVDCTLAPFYSSHPIACNLCSPLNLLVLEIYGTKAGSVKFIVIEMWAEKHGLKTAWNLLKHSFLGLYTYPTELEVGYESQRSVFWQALEYNKLETFATWNALEAQGGWDQGFTRLVPWQQPELMAEVGFPCLIYMPKSPMHSRWEWGLHFTSSLQWPGDAAVDPCSVPGPCFTLIKIASLS